MILQDPSSDPGAADRAGPPGHGASRVPLRQVVVRSSVGLDRTSARAALRRRPAPARRSTPAPASPVASDRSWRGCSSWPRSRRSSRWWSTWCATGCVPLEPTTDPTPRSRSSTGGARRSGPRTQIAWSPRASGKQRCAPGTDSWSGRWSTAVSCPTSPGAPPASCARTWRLTTPDAGAAFDTASLLFELAWYAHVPTGAEQSAQLRRAADAVLAATPERTADQGPSAGPAPATIEVRA